MKIDQLLPRLPTMLALAVALALLGVVLYLIAQPFVPALVWALTLAVMGAPVERFLRRRTGSPGLAAGSTLLLCAIGVVIPVITVASALLNEIIAGAGTYGALFSGSGLAELQQTFPRLAALVSGVPQWLDLQQVVQFLAAQLGRWSGALVQQSANGMFTLLLTFYFLFYLLRDRDRALAALRGLLPLTHGEFDELIEKTSQTVFASVYATAAVAVLQGLLGGLMFWWLGLPAPVFWGVVMGLLAIVPFLGAFVVWVPVAMGLALSGNWLEAVVLTVWGTVVVGLIDNILYPILVGKRLSLHPMLSFIAIIGGLLLFGAHGIVLGPLTFATAQAVLHIWRSRIAPQRVDSIGTAPGPA
jgi:predicted PurR-regulated permease PerM